MIALRLFAFLRGGTFLLMLVLPTKLPPNHTLCQLMYVLSPNHISRFRTLLTMYTTHN